MHYELCIKKGGKAFLCNPCILWFLNNYPLITIH